MYSFKSDYSEGAHPKIMDALVETNLIQTDGYGIDQYCDMATEKLKELVNNTDIDVHYLIGGTQTNLTFIAAALKSYQAVIALDTAHIVIHETGAIENTGHKIIITPHIDGKLTIECIERVLAKYVNEHRVMPKMVFISQTTEFGTAYTTDELKKLYDCCQNNGLYLYIDGARLASSLSIEGCPSLEEITKYCDAYYIGGTKVGCLFGECLVIKNEELKLNFRYVMKQHGSLLAKGRMLGIQFLSLFSNDLYYEIGLFQNNMANKIKEAIMESGYELYVDSNTNQLFPIFDKNKLDEIDQEFTYNVIEEFLDGSKCIRLVTSWATIPHKVDRLISIIKQ